MNLSIARRLRRDDGAGPLPAAHTVSRLATVYTDERVLEGELGDSETGAPELTNLAGRMTLRNVAITNLADESATRVPSHVVPANKAAIISGSVSRTSDVSSRRYRITLRTGPYYVQGYMEAGASVDLTTQLRLQSQIALTDALVEYTLGWRLKRDIWPALWVNRRLVESIAEAWDPDISHRPGSDRSR